MIDEMIPRTPPWFSLLSPWQQAPGPWQLLAPASPTSYSLASSMPSTGPSKRSQTPLCQSWWQRRRWERPSRCWRWWPSALSLWRSHSMGCSTGPLSTCFLAPSSLCPLLSLASSFSSSCFSILEWRKEGALQPMLTTFYDWMKVFQHWQRLLLCFSEYYVDAEQKYPVALNSWQLIEWQGWDDIENMSAFLLIE